VFQYKAEVSPQFNILDIPILLTLISIGIYMIYMIFRFTEHHKRKNTARLYIDIVGVHDHVLVQLMTLPHFAALYRFRATSFMDDVSVTGFLRLKLLYVCY
jgi:hypothetical protein